MFGPRKTHRLFSGGELALFNGDRMLASTDALLMLEMRLARLFLNAVLASM
jgi:hypothetical protein